MRQIILLLLFVSMICSKTAWSFEAAAEMLGQADLLADRYQWGKALPLYQEAEKHLSEYGDAVGATFARLGRIRSSAGELAVQRMYEALDRELGRLPERNNQQLRLRALFLKADVGSDIDAFSAGVFNADQRRRDWQEILSLSQKLGDRHLENRARGELGILKVLDGDPIGSDEVSEVLWRATETGDFTNELRFRTAVAVLYNSAGRVHDARGHLDRAVELAMRERAISYFPAYFEKALILIESHRLQEAMPLVEHCIAQAHLTDSPANNAQAQYLQGRVYLESGRFTESMEPLRQALTLASEIGYHRLISMSSLELSRIYRKHDDLWKALDCAETGIRSSLKTGDPMEAILHIQNKAAVKANQGRFIEADRLYSEALQALNVLLRKFTSAHSRAFLVARMSDLYTDYFSLALLKLKDPAKAFIVLEQARGRSVSDSLQGRWIDAASTEVKNDQSPNEIFEKSLAQLQRQLWQRKDAQEFKRIQSEIFDLEQHLGPSRKAGRHNIEAQTFPFISLPDFQKTLYQEEIVLQYILREPSSICLAISRDGVQGIELAPRSVIENAVKAYREEILQNRQGAQTARTLYNLLLAPIPGFGKKMRITIIPDGLLHLLPFEAILTPSGRILLDSHLIDYSPSSTVMFLLRKLAAVRKGNGRFLGVGDARLPSVDESSTFFANAPQPSRLPGSRAEILSIVDELKDEFETTVLLDEEANEENIKALNLSKFDILHFAVHGTSDMDFPARSALLLGPRSSESGDGILQAWEISRLRLKADLVVLSACDTAVGKLLDQVGVSNLVHSFLLAGARAVVASIWPMEDRPTADLMIRFYSYLAQGMDKGSALRQAKLDFIAKYKDKALPIHWAGMLMIGDSSDSILGMHRANSAGDKLP